MKREVFKLQKQILSYIEKNPGISMSELERKIRTNPASLRAHCKHLEELGIITINRTQNTTKLKKK